MLRCGGPTCPPAPPATQHNGVIRGRILASCQSLAGLPARPLALLATYPAASMPQGSGILPPLYRGLHAATPPPSAARRCRARAGNPDLHFNPAVALARPLPAAGAAGRSAAPRTLKKTVSGIRGASADLTVTGFALVVVVWYTTTGMATWRCHNCGRQIVGDVKPSRAARACDDCGLAARPPRKRKPSTRRRKRKCS